MFTICSLSALHTIPPHPHTVVILPVYIYVRLYHPLDEETVVCRIGLYFPITSIWCTIIDHLWNEGLRSDQNQVWFDPVIARSSPLFARALFIGHLCTVRSAIAQQLGTTVV